MTQKELLENIEEALYMKATELRLGNNRLAELPPEIANLTGLQWLNLDKNLLTTLPPEAAKLTALQTLSLANNRLTTLPPEITELTALQVLNLDNNRLTTLPPEITKLTGLRELYLENNQLKTLPPEITKLTALRHLDLRGNQLPIPAELLAKWRGRAQEILAYYAQTLSEENLPVNEVKMLFVGQGFAGKTSLAQALKTGRADPNVRVTDGILRDKWTPEGEEITVNIWDFGGQEIMHHTHQFFLTERSLYLLVLNSRQSEEENRVEYWLKLIQTFGGSAPVLVVVNKAEESPLQLNERGLQEKYPNIKGFFRTAACPKTGEPQGVAALKQAICAEINAIKAVRDGLPASCFAVKQALEEMQGDFITHTEFYALCGEKRVPAALHDTLLDLLHDLGVVLNYRKHERFDLAETNVLNPEWVTNGVYAIINHLHRVSEKQGVLHIKMLDSLLNPARHPKEKHKFLLGMMEQFLICYKMNAHEYLLPDLLSPQETDTGEWEETPMFVYQYEIALPLIMTRFIVKMSPRLSKHTCWKTGALLTYEGSRALVKADWAERRIAIWIDGGAGQRRSFLSLIRNEFQAIHDTFEALKVTERVPIPGTQISVDYQHLLTLERKGVREQIFEGMSDAYSVQDLLNGVADFNTRQRDFAPAEDVKPPAPQPPPPLPNPWLSGSFYLVAFVVVIAACGLVAKFVSLAAVVPAFIISLLAVGVIGAFQLKQDNRMSEKGFLSLMGETYKQLPLLNRAGKSPSPAQRNRR